MGANVSGRSAPAGALCLPPALLSGRPAPTLAAQPRAPLTPTPLPPFPLHPDPSASTGRDSYIYTNNGGLSRERIAAPIRTIVATSWLPPAPCLTGPKPVFRWSDGTGRDR